MEGMQVEGAPRAMRRANREVADAEGLRGIFEACTVVRLAAADAEGPFIVPMNFGYDWELDDAGAPRPVLWLHSAGEGRKADAFDADPRVAIEMDVDDGVITGDYACEYSLAYRSVMGSGCIARVEDAEGKRHGLARIMEHVAPGSPVTFGDAAVRQVTVWRVEVERLTGKRRTM